MVSSRGQVTLPAEMRRHLGIGPGGAEIVEECEGELRIKPVALIEVGIYNDEQIAAWDRADVLDPKEWYPFRGRDAVAQHSTSDR